ncbi:molecular chaperone DnaJ [Porphyrobacter sp. GA68]|uniref:molecular chaperone DnaJ n=1 Tax=Porphyrobacter sp. GA68 TaxID=2883480 RepID=UPI001D17D79F|nr:molecular chaperone DnaJ [Porphyrobacter sp. GA68]
MSKLVIIALVALLVWRMVTGRWPWQPRRPQPQGMSVAEAQAILGVDEDAGRLEIFAAHRRLVARIHPDRGGSAGDTQAANAARDTLLAHWKATH